MHPRIIARRLRERRMSYESTFFSNGLVNLRGRVESSRKKESLSSKHNIHESDGRVQRFYPRCTEYITLTGVKYSVYCGDDYVPLQRNFAGSLKIFTMDGIYAIIKMHFKDIKYLQRYYNGNVSKSFSASSDRKK
ncbi:hypothetical protein AVEN_131309-1 [Araneus ventricosus]|uniref:Uncharacterized protein n=1 Tax=Araneus ventricosus TaxID=182803 RepID=A0A4Y2U0W6_ARAVE|nr:hypothetical protein AVEN_131309-1 [Araneus ventricosus]